jgi:hypothetical protein
MYTQDDWTNFREAAELTAMKNAHLRERRRRCNEEAAETRRLSREEYLASLLVAPGLRTIQVVASGLGKQQVLQCVGMS